MSRTSPLGGPTTPQPQVAVAASADLSLNQLMMCLNTEEHHSSVPTGYVAREAIKVMALINLLKFCMQHALLH